MDQKRDEINAYSDSFHSVNNDLLQLSQELDVLIIRHMKLAKELNKQKRSFRR
ncbi:hypothetical protein D3C71_2213350 [compost metagenome]